jgi:hypothetical protein
VELYDTALEKVGSQFTDQFRETHHAFNVPARSYIDNQIIDSLTQRGLLDCELVADVLAVDFTVPVYSGQRLSLVNFLPETATTADELRQGLIEALSQAPGTDAAAQELLANLKDPARTAAFHRQRAADFVALCRQEAKTLDVVVDWLRIASQRRAEVLVSETASSEQGNILEQGFREVFPSDALNSQPGKLRLDLETARAKAN